MKLFFPKVSEPGRHNRLHRRRSRVVEDCVKLKPRNDVIHKHIQRSLKFIRQLLYSVSANSCRSGLRYMSS